MTGHPIRAAEPSDLAFMMSLASRLTGVADLAWRTPEQIASFQQDFMQSCLSPPPQGSATLVAEGADGAPIGFIQVQSQPDGITGEPSAYVSLLAVSPEAEGKGAGQALMASAAEWAKAHGFRYLALDVFASNTRGRAFYARLGFGEETVRMVKPLVNPA